MSLGVLLSEAREAWRVHETCERIHRESGPLRFQRFRLYLWLARWAAPALLAFGLPAYQRYFAWLRHVYGAVSAPRVGPSLWILVMVPASLVLTVFPFILFTSFLLIVAVSLYGKLHWTVFDALHAVSPRGALLARYWSDLLWLAYLGVCLAWFGYQAAWQAEPVTVSLVCFVLAAGLTPALVYTTAVLLLFLTMRSGWFPRAGSFYLFFFVCGSLLSSFALREPWMGHRLEIGWLTVAPAPVWPVATAAGVLLALAIQVWQVGLIPPWERIGSSQKMGPAQKIGPAGQRAIKGGGDIGAASARAERPAQPMAGGATGLLAAADVYMRTRFTRQGLWSLLSGVSGRGLRVLLFVMLIQLGGIKSDTRWVMTFLMITYLAVSYPLFHLPHPHRMHLWGVDYRRQMCFNLATSWIDPGLFVGLLVAAGLALFGQSIGWPLGWSLAFLIVAVKVFAAGLLEWPTLPLSLASQVSRANGKTEQRLMGRSLLVTSAYILVLVVPLLLLLLAAEIPLLLLARGLWPGVDDRWLEGFAFFGTLALAGLGGIAYKLFFLDEDTLRERLRRVPA